MRNWKAEGKSKDVSPSGTLTTPSANPKADGVTLPSSETSNHKDVSSNKTTGLLMWRQVLASLIFP